MRRQKSISLGVDPGGAVERLAREHRIAASVTPYAERHVRLGTGLSVDEADVDAAVPPSSGCGPGYPG